VAGGQAVYRETPLLSEAVLAMVDLLVFRAPFRTRTDFEARVPAETRAAFERAARAAHAGARPLLAAAWKRRLREAREGGAAAAGQGPGAGCEAERGAGGVVAKAESGPDAMDAGVAGGGGPMALAARPQAAWPQA
jgi:hypothetical protein